MIEIPDENRIRQIVREEIFEAFSSSELVYNIKGIMTRLLDHLDERRREE